MSDHEFERQVRQKLNHLKMDPSAKAWENIEEELRDRRRRAPFLLLPMLMIGLAVGGYIMYHYGFKKTTDGDTLVAKMESILPVTEKKLTAPEASVSTVVAQPNTVPAKTGTANNKIKHSGTSLVKHAAELADNSIKDNSTVSDSKEKAEIITDNNTNNNNSRQSAVTNDAPVKNKPALNASPRYELVNTDNSTAVKKITNKKTSKWSFGVSAFAGTSFVNNGDLLNFDQSKVEDVSASRAPVPAFTGVNNYRRGSTPSVVSPGFSFSAGAVVKRELSKRFSVSAGLTYTQLNTLTRVGQKINSAQVVNTGIGYLSVQNYYLLDETQTYVYKNRYHFIELPVSVFYRINYKGKLPIYLNGGLVVSRLLQSTSLHFDGTTGVYYKNDRLINQTQAGVSTGVSVALFSKSSRPLWVGPTVRSNISSILEKEVSENKHFMMLGLDLKYFIK